MAVAITSEGARHCRSWQLRLPVKEQGSGNKEEEREKQDQYGQEINDGDHW